MNKNNIALQTTIKKTIEMPFEKGKSGNPAGRKKGFPNRTTEQTRDKIQKFIEKNWQRMQKDFDAMEPLERLKFMNSLLKFVLPSPLHDYEDLSDEDLNKIVSELKAIGYDTLGKN